MHDVAFYLVYVREAHALDSAMPMEFGVVEDPTTDQERADMAGTCVDELDLPMPALVDGIDDAVGRAYAGWPDRLYLVGLDGKIAFAGAPGPAGFDCEAWNAAIERECARVPAPPTEPPTPRAPVPAPKSGQGRAESGG